jgi:plastocyanin
MALLPSVSGVSASHAQSAQLYHIAIGLVSGDPIMKVNEFVPDRLIIHVGDRVQWDSALDRDAQTVTFGAQERTQPLIIVPSGSEINPAVVKPQGGVRVVDTTHNVYSSGLLMRGLQGARSTYTFQFPKAGTYIYRSWFHPHMTGEIDVVPAGQSTSRDRDPKDDLATYRDAAQSISQALRAFNIANYVGNSTVDPIIHIAVGDENTSINAFAPSGIRIQASDTVTTHVTWQIDETSGDPHVLLFGQASARELLGQMPLYTGFTADGGLRINPAYTRVTLSSGSIVSNTVRFSSGVLYGSDPNFPSAVSSSYSLTFTAASAPGVAFVDPFHPGMTGQVTTVP